MFSKKNTRAGLKTMKICPQEKQCHDFGWEAIVDEQFKTACEGLYTLRIQALI